MTGAPLREVRGAARLPLNLALALLVGLWAALFLWRKSFSYIRVGPAYIIELTALAALGAFLAYVLMRADLRFRIPRDRGLRWTAALAIVFVGYNVTRAVFSTDMSAKGLIPGIYPAYFVIAALVAANASGEMLRRAAWVFAAFYFLSPTVSYFNGWFISYFPVLGALESPGWTYVYGVSMAMALALVRRPLLSMALFSVYFVTAMFVFQRGTFVCFALGGFTLLAALRWRQGSAVFSRALVRGGLVGVAGILIAPFAFEFLTGSQSGRFLVTPENMLKFFYSIFTSDVTIGGGAVGTREHRLEMWTAIVKLVFSSIKTALFGFGYAGEVGDALNVPFRAPHNGFVTILYRSGVIGLTLFVGLLLSIFGIFARAVRSGTAESPWRWPAALCLIAIGSLVGDALAGTILDSPFTSMMFYVHVAVVAVLVVRQQDAARVTGSMEGPHTTPATSPLR